MVIAPGATLKGQYRIDALIGGGGMAVVYRAFDLNLQRVCAIKQNLDTAPQAQQQFHVEAITLANLSHPHLARVTDHFLDTTGQQYLVMDFVDGENLDAYVARNGPLPERQALFWMHGVFDALAYCHRQGVIHRDVKPANLIKRRGEDAVTLVDFGIAKQQAVGLTLTGARAATPAFAPPEQFSGHTNASSDVYALGATLYYLLSGVEPPDARLTAAGLAQVTPLRSLNPRISAATAQAVQQAMALRVGERPQSVAALQTALRGTTAGHQPPPPPGPVPSPVRPRGARSRWAALAVLILFAGLAGLFLAFNRPDDSVETATTAPVATTVAAAIDTVAVTPALTEMMPPTGIPTETATSVVVASAPTAATETQRASRSPTSTPAMPATPTPTPTWTPSPPRPAATATLSGVPGPTAPSLAPVLVSPPNNTEQRDQVDFQWTHAGLKPGQQYRIDLLTEHVQDTKEKSFFSNGSSLTVLYDQYPIFFKDDGSTFFWSVVVVSASGNLASPKSEEWRFVIRRGSAQPPTPEPPTPTPTPRG